MLTVGDPAAGTLRRPALRFGPLALVWALVGVAVALYLTSPRTTAPQRLSVGNCAIALALVFSVVLCARAARRRTPERRAWTWMTVAMTLGGVGQLVFTASALRGQVPAPSAVTDALNYLGYSLPCLIALFCFPKPRERLISRFREVLDAVVITVGVLLVSEATVVRALQATTDFTSLTGLTRLSYPAADIANGAVVLTLGMRQPPKARATWLCLGAGLLSLSVTDSAYVRLLAEGGTNLTGSLLVVGWIAAPVLIGLATVVPRISGGSQRSLDLASRLVPYAPVLGGALVLGLGSVQNDPFLLAGGIVMLTVVTVRQVMIVYENLSLTRDLEAKVAARTAELARLGSIVTSSRDAIVGFALDGRITAWNPAAELLYGYPAAAVLGRLPDFMPPATQERIRVSLAAAAAGEPLEGYESDWHRPDGTVLPIAVTISPVVDGDVVEGVSFSGQDITERRRAAAVLEQAREEALQSSRLKSEFLATMSHEIRTPMNGVIGLTSLLMDTALDGQQRGYAEGVHSAGQSLLDVINDILDFSKLEAGKVIIESDDFDLRRLVEEVGNLLAPAAFAKGLELLVDYPSTAPSVVRGDHVRVRQILLNLASNAVKFTSVGEVEMKVAATPAGEGRTGLRFEVLDTGIGIAEADQGRLFESFSQADASTTRRYGGTGLGLAISRQLVEAMDGEIGLDSAPGRGSTFWFTLELPLGEVAPPSLAEAAVELPPGLRALVVDDNETNRTILDGQLRAWGMDVGLAEGAAAALTLLREAVRAGRPYDLAVLDMLMPEMDGLQLARAITTDPELSGLRMIMLTSAQRLPTALFRDAGISRCLTKPVSTPELYDRLARLVSRTEGGRPAGPAGPAEETAPTPVPVGRGRVLVVEDNALNQLVAVGMVARLGFETVTADHGAQALQELARGRFDAVLMDCHMPVMDGFAATEEIRRRERGGRRTPVIALTAGALVSDRERCLAAGMDDYLPKPLDGEALGAALERWVPEPAPGHAEAPAADPEGPREPSPAAAAPPDAANGTAGAAGADGQSGTDGTGGRDPRQSQDGQDGAPIDTARLESLGQLRSADGTSLLATFVRTFTDSSGNRTAAIRQAAVIADDEALARAAHELKGSAATIGAFRVAELCRQLELGRLAAVRDRPGLLDDLDVELEQANQALCDLVATLA